MALWEQDNLVESEYIDSQLQSELEESKFLPCVRVSVPAKNTNFLCAWVLECVCVCVCVCIDRASLSVFV